MVLVAWIVVNFVQPIRETGESAARGLGAIAAVCLAIGVIFAALRKARRWRPVAWFERNLITLPIRRKRVAADVRIATVVDNAIKAAIDPLHDALARLEVTNSAQHAEVQVELRRLSVAIEVIDARVLDFHRQNTTRLDNLEAAVTPDEPKESQ